MGHSIDFLRPQESKSQKTKLAQCGLISCSKIEREANTFHRCPRCLVAAYCCKAHMQMAFQVPLSCPLPSMHPLFLLGRSLRCSEERIASQTPLSSFLARATGVAPQGLRG